MPDLTLPPQPPPPPAVPITAAPPEALRAVQAAIVALSAGLQLLRLTPEERARIGRAGGLSPIRKSLACLRLLQKRPDLAARLPPATVAEWRRLVDLRLAIAQARSALDATLKAASGGELLILSQITEANDAIEDHLLSWMERPGATDAERLRLRAKFDDPASIRQSYAEFRLRRGQRRERRRALQAAALSALQARTAHARAKDRLTRSAHQEEAP